jgi:transcription initiation factor TFIIIB Brf1 subunit/transcription initiation factor TFIIB
MIETSEEIVQSLNGETDACIRAAELLTEAWEHQYFRGRSADNGIAAVVYTTFRQLEKPRPLSVVADTCGVSKQQLRTGYRALRKDCELESPLGSRRSYVPYLSTQLGASKEAERDAKRLAESASEVGGSPVSVAAACMYLISQGHGQKVTLAEAGNAAGIAKETVWLKTQELRSVDKT